MRDGLTTGHRGELALTVGPEHTIHLNAVGQAAGESGAVVFSTPNMINLMEHAAREALHPFLEANEESVGMTVDIAHTAATPLGADVQAVATVTAVKGKVVDFDIEAFDGAEPIGKGTHRRAIIRVDKFRERLTDKTAALPTGVVWPMNLRPDTGSLPTFPTLAVQLDGAVATVTLNRPGKLNAVDRQMTGDMEKLFAWLAGHPQVRVVIMTGAGRAFCAGDDVKEVGTLDLQEAELLSLRQARMYLAIEQLPQVFIAAVNGQAFGGGCVAAYSCDMRLA
ncbi:MAG: enoyl-CoA hydratase-related protein, partial [Phycisphaeraceae bacterium]